MNLLESFKFLDFCEILAAREGKTGPPFIPTYGGFIEMGVLSVFDNLRDIKSFR